MSKLGSVRVASTTFMALIGALLAPPGATRAVDASCTRECARNCQARCLDRSCVLACSAACSLCTPCGACVTFEVPRGKEVYGAGAGTPAGGVVSTSSGVSMAVDSFELPSGAKTFGTASVGPPPPSFGSGLVLSSNNVNLVFDYAGAGFTPSEVQLEFLDLGGVQNLSVNGSPVFVGRLVHAPPLVAGVTISVFSAPLSGGTTGIVLLRGAIKSFAIGGQELWIDNVCAKP